MRVAGCVVVGLTLVSNAAAEYPHIEVFTTAHYPVSIGSAPWVTIYTLDAPATVENELSRTLPRDPATAQAYAQQALRSACRDPAKRSAAAYQGLRRARQYGIQKLPAIVLDGRALVYGITNLSTALDYYRGHSSDPVDCR